VKKWSIFSVACSLIALLAFKSSANTIDYPLSGSINTASYTFVASSTGSVKAYFAGSNAAYDNEIGLLVNGVDTGIYGLNNHTSALGDELDFGVVNAGDVLTFVLRNHTLGNMQVFSDPEMNANYDAPLAGVNHIYSTAYLFDSSYSPYIPSGTYVGFEDKTYSSSPDWDYNDEQFVFTNVGPTPGPVPAVPLPSAAWAGMALLPAIIGARKIRERQSD
jgi:hypothetical protein